MSSGMFQHKHLSTAAFIFYYDLFEVEANPLDLYLHLALCTNTQLPCFNCQYIVSKLQETFHSLSNIIKPVFAKLSHRMGNRLLIGI